MITRRTIGHAFVGLGAIFGGTTALILVAKLSNRGRPPTLEVEAWCGAVAGWLLLCGWGTLRGHRWARPMALISAWCVGVLGLVVSLNTLFYGAARDRFLTFLPGALASVLLVCWPAGIVLWRFHGRKGRALFGPSGGDDGDTEDAPPSPTVAAPDDGATPTTADMARSAAGETKTFRLGSQAIARERTRLIVFFAGFAVIYGATQLLAARPRPAIDLPVLLAVLTIVSAGSVLALRSRMRQLRSLRFEIDPHGIAQAVRDAPRRWISRRDLRRVVTIDGLGLALHSTGKRTPLWVPASVEGFDELAARLTAWEGVEHQSLPPRRTRVWLGYALSLLLMAAMVVPALLLARHLGSQRAVFLLPALVVVTLVLGRRYDPPLIGL